MRIAFPIKVFIACLAVVAAGALPTYIYIETTFVDELMSARAQETSHRASLLAESLRPLTRQQRLAQIQTQARTRVERISYIAPTGVVLFDSSGDGQTLDDHSARPEVLMALGSSPPDSSILETPQVGIGAAIRRSKTTGVNSIYIAVRIDDTGEVVRLAFPVHDVGDLHTRLSDVFRASQATSLLVALLLSIVAAFVFMRPLQRLVRSANAIALGDFTASETWRSNDEISDVGNALNTLALELRQRLAIGQAAETLLIQAAEFLTEPVALIGPDGRVLLVNGAFRRAIEDPTTDAEDVLGRLLGSKKYAKAFERERTGGDGEILDWARKKIGVELEMHLLERPATDPVVLLTLHRESLPTLPSRHEVVATPLPTLLDAATVRVTRQIEGCALAVDYVGDAPRQATVVEAEQRVQLGLALFLESASRGRERLRIRVTELDLSVEIWVDGEPAAAALRLVRLLVEPLGGRIVVADNVTLHLARA